MAFTSVSEFVRGSLRLGLILTACVLILLYSLYPFFFPFLSDFGAYYMATQVFLTDPTRLYDPTLYQELGVDFMAQYGLQRLLGYINPPLLAIILSPLGVFSYYTSRAVWSCINLLLFAWNLRTMEKLCRMLHLERIAQWLCLLMMLWHYSFQALTYGQISFVLLTLFTQGILFAIRNNRIGVVVCLSLCAAIKPHLFIPLILCLLIRSDYRWFRAFTVSGVFLGIVMSVICGFGIWLSYIHYFLGASGGQIDMNASFQYMVNLRGLIVYFTGNAMEHSLSHLMLLVYGCWCALAFWLSRFRLASFDLPSFLCVIFMGGLFFSPWLHAHDMLLLLPCLIVWLASKPLWLSSPTGKIASALLLILHLPFVYLPYSFMIKPTAIALNLFAIYAAFRWIKARNA